jgi:peptide/nickel transport system permease protein
VSADIGLRLASARRSAIRHPMLLAGLGLLGLVVLFAVLGPYLYDTALAGIGTNRPRRPPGGVNPLGTDSQGRDVLAALILATPQTLKIGLFAGLIGLSAGVFLGLVAGFFRGIVDAVIRTAADVAMTIPGIAVLVLVATNVRSMSVVLMAVIVAGLAWMYPTRTIRAQTLSMRERPYVDIARLNGIGDLRLVMTEILPNLLPYIAASFVTAVSSAMLATIGLEALGLGPQNELTLGMMIFWSQFYGAILRNMWWWWTPPVLMLATIFIGLLLTSAGMDRLVNARLRVES